MMMVICYDNYRHDLQDHHYKGAFLQSLQSRPSVLSRPQQFSFFFSSFSSFSFSFFSSFFPIIPGHPCFPGDTPSCYCCCCDHPEGQASCRWSSGGTGLLANDHPEGPSSCKWSSGRAGRLQMIIRRDRPLANEYQEGPASCKWSSGETGLFQDPESISRTFLKQFVLGFIFCQGSWSRFPLDLQPLCVGRILRRLSDPWRLQSWTGS